MKKALLGAFILMLSLTAAGIAKAQTSRLYFAGYLGLNMNSEHEFGESTTQLAGTIDTKNAFSFAGALGLRLNKNLRLEAEVSTRSSDFSAVDFNGGATRKMGKDLSTTMYLANIYYDFDFEWQHLYPFLTAGAGLVWHTADIEDASALLPNATDSSVGFAYTAGGGLKYRLSPTVALTSSYRYIGTSDLEIDTYDLDYNSHEVRLGLEYDIPVNWFK